MLREGGSLRHQSTAFLWWFKELFVSITRFFRSLSPFIAILGAEKPRLVISLPLFYYDAQLTGVAIENACFCFDDRLLSVFLAHAAQPGRV